MVMAVIMTLSLVLGQAFASAFNPVVDTITSSSDSRISEMISAISLQSFSSPTAAKVQSYISYFIYDSKYAAINGSAWPYTNERGYVSTVTDGTYTISGINGSGCFAYSKFVMNVIYGTTGSVLKEGESAGSITASGLETFLRTYAQAGEQLRLGNIHSVTFISCTSKGFYYLDYWGGYIRLHYTTFEKFASACNNATSSVELWLYNANTNVNDVSLQETESDSSSEDGDEASTLNISPTSYPSGQLIYGNYFNLAGSITSNYTITEITGTIYTEEDTSVQSKSDTPNTTYVSIISSVLNDLSFGSLSVGNYYLTFTATDSSGTSVIWTSDTFSVVTAVSSLSINPINYPTGSMVAQSFDLSGTVTSNYTLTTVSAFINDTDGNTLYSAMVSNINSTSFNILNSGIDNSLPFGSLPVGSYVLIYEASDSSGTTVSWTSDVFYIISEEDTAESSTDNSADTDTDTDDSADADTEEAEAEEYEEAEEDAELNDSLDTEADNSDDSADTGTDDSENAEAGDSTDADIDDSDDSSTGESTLTITPTSYPTGNISKDAYNISGTITSNYTITSATAQIVSANGTVEQEVIDSPNTKSYSLATSFNRNLKFARLESGFYYLYFFATDSSGASTYWMSDVFAVADSTLYVDVQDSSTWYYWQVYSLSADSIFNGVAVGSSYYFYPSDTLTRAETVCLLYRIYCNAYGTPTVSGSYPFTDCTNSSWYDTELTWAYQNGIINGTSATSFSPNNEITRQELAQILYNYAVLFNGDSVSSNSLADYTDEDSIASWAKDAVNWCIENSIFSSTSTSQNTFSPSTIVTRSQSAVVFENAKLLFY